MATTLQSSRNAQYTPCFAVTPQNELIVVDGVNPGRVWNGVSGSTTRLGIVAPTVAPTVLTPVGGAATAGDYVCYYRYKDVDGNYSSGSPATTVTAVANDSFDWTITSSGDAQVTQVELLRTLVGDTAVLYLVTTLNAGTTTYSDTLSDVVLAALTSVAVDNTDSSSNLASWDPPPTTRFATPHFDRMFYYGFATYAHGTVEANNASPTITGRGTNWTDQMDDWKMYFTGSTTEYTVDSLSGQVITLSANFGGTTNLFQTYALKPHKNFRRRVYYTPVLQPRGLRATDFVVPAEDGDDYTGGFTLGKFLYVCEPARIWRLFMTSMQSRESANNKPGVGMQHAEYRGAINHRCIVRSDHVAYILDQDGIYAFDGDGAQDIGGPIQDYIRDGKINWAASDWFFASTDESAELIYWHVSLGESYLPSHALVFHTGTQKWEGVFEWPWTFGAYTTALMGGEWRRILGGEFGKFHVTEGTLDGPTDRTIRGTATSATALTITDTSSDAVLPASGVVGASLAVVGGRGKGQKRRVVASASGTMTLDRPLHELPDTTSEYQVGGVDWRAKTGIYEYPSHVTKDTKQPREIVVVCEPTAEECTMDIRRYLDHSGTPENYVSSDTIGEVTIERDKPDAKFSLKRVKNKGVFTGRIHTALSGYVHDRLNNGRYLQVELRGVQGMDRVKVYGLTLQGVTAEIEG